MSINKKVALQWRGNKYSLLVTMRHVDDIESEFNLIMFANQLNSGDCRYSKLSWLVAKFLRMAAKDLLQSEELKGEKKAKAISASEVSQDDIWSEMFGNGDVSPTDALGMARSIVSACLPEIPEEAAAKKKSTKKKPKK